MKLIDFYKDTRPDEPNYVMDDESYAQESMNEVPKSPKGPPPDNENVWTDAPKKKAPADTPFFVSNRLCSTKEGDNGIVTLLNILDCELTRTYLIDTVDGRRLKLHSHSFVQPENQDIAAIPFSASYYACESRHIRKKQAQHVAWPKKLSPLKQCFLSWHERLDNFKKENMFELVNQGILLSKFAQLKADIPLCDSFIYWQTQHKYWRTRRKKAVIWQDTINAPGTGMSTVKLVSGQPGLIPQIGGHLTASRIWATNVFVDYFSDLLYVHLMQSTTQEETLNANAAYQRFFNNHGIKVCRYHANNKLYSKKSFWGAVADAGQTITYCGVSAHHQNGIETARIKNLRLVARTMLLYDRRYWREDITTMIWRCDIKATGLQPNRFHLIDDSLSPLKIFSGVETTFDLKLRHTWGCPAYIMDAKLQNHSGGAPEMGTKIASWYLSWTISY